MSDIWNIHVCAAAQCGGVESIRTFDNNLTLPSRFPLMHEAASLQGNLAVDVSEAEQSPLSSGGGGAPKVALLRRNHPNQHPLQKMQKGFI